MPQLQHFLLTNFNVHRDDADRDVAGEPVRTSEWLEARFELFERFCLPSVVAQTCPDFIWLLGYDDEGTPPEYRARLREHEDGFANLRLLPERTSFRQAIAVSLGSRRCRLLTTRLDNDDALQQGALALLQSHADGDDLEFLNLPLGYSYSYPDGETRFREEASNHFLSLAENYKGEPPRTAVCANHNHASEVAPLRQLGREPRWLEVIHGRNLRNRLKGRPCAPPEWEEEFNVGGTRARMAAPPAPARISR